MWIIVRRFIFFFLIYIWRIRFVIRSFIFIGRLFYFYQFINFIIYYHWLIYLFLVYRSCILCRFILIMLLLLFIYFFFIFLAIFCLLLLFFVFVCLWSLRSDRLIFIVKYQLTWFLIAYSYFILFILFQVGSC
jgi:hypothetical protein